MRAGGRVSVVAYYYKVYNFICIVFAMRWAQLVSVSASDTNSKVQSSNPAGNKKSFSVG